MGSGSPGLRLGGLAFGVHCDDAHLLPEESEAYLPFWGLDSPTAADIRLHLSFDDPPAVDHLCPLFVGGRLYTVYALGTERVVVQRPPGAARPAWVARFSPALDSVTVWCAPASLRSTSVRPSIVSPLRYPLDQILLMYALASRGGVLVHAAGVVVGGRALVCCGRSGAGKSTLARQFLAAGTPDMLSDDRVIVRRTGPDVVAHGTPWHGDARIVSAESFPTEALLFLKHGGENRLKTLSPAEALHRFLPVASIPWYDPEVLPGSLAFCEELLGSVPAFEFEFVPEPAAAEMVRDAFVGAACEATPKAAAGTFAQLANDVLARGDSIRFCARGRSMMPSIRDGDVLRVDPLSSTPARLGEVVLYRDAGGRPVAHRVVGPVLRRGAGSPLVIRGDAFRGPGERIRGEWILGRVVGVEREGRDLPAPATRSRGRGLARAWGLRLAARIQCVLGRVGTTARAAALRPGAASDDRVGPGVR